MPSSLLFWAVAIIVVLPLPLADHFEVVKMSSSEALFKSLEDTKVEYRRLGKSGLRISVPILGTMSIGNPAWGPWILEEDEVS